ncbi:hypothetical protein D9757_012329 [Collybiopsis confluens]|uniref:Uncharacterized protein n=1 Tax=Collybiopsis confluens TaxID=2823264 RepID=A0A8H5GAP5_9AGAR|nr:hypothetical protein D9757_012329 [Collybiopsis confluens]
MPDFDDEILEVVEADSKKERKRKRDRGSGKSKKKKTQGDVNIILLMDGPSRQVTRKGKYVDEADMQRSRAPSNSLKVL